MTKQLPQEPEKPVCFVVMPIADVPGYEPGHFGRVYEHLLKPAIQAAGYRPVRADDAVKTDYIVVGIIQKIVESAMVLCDFSGRNPNVMYELGVRHAFDKPVVLIKDRRTEKIFDIQGLRHIEYEESLRIDAVHKDVARITKAIQDTAEASPGDLNSIVRLAGVMSAEVPTGQAISADTKLILTTLGSLERRIGEMEEQRSKPIARAFRVEGDRVLFLPHEDSSEKGEDLFVDGRKYGKLIALNDLEQSITVRRVDGREIKLTPNSSEAFGVNSIPF